jgi:hypothetical protein
MSRLLIACLILPFFATHLRPAEPAGAAPPNEEVQTVAVPIPTPKPTRIPSFAMLLRSPAEAVTTAPFETGCRNSLRQLQVDFEIPAEVEGTLECIIPDPVQLRTIDTPLGEVELSAGPILDCPFAQKFTLWVSDIAAPVIASLGEARLARIATGPGYECRRRNNDPTAKLSEHAFGNAIDIAGFTLSNNETISVGGDAGEPGEQILRSLRLSACGYFTTVLGPGSGAAHEDHLHFDLSRRGKSGDARFCR